YRKSNSISKIENVAFISFHQVFYRQDMCLSKVRYMDVISDTSTVFCIIIGSENTNGFTLSVRHLENQRNQMCLRIMRFPDLSAYMSAACIEVTKGYIAKSMSLSNPFEHLFHRK